MKQHCAVLFLLGWLALGLHLLFAFSGVEAQDWIAQPITAGFFTLMLFANCRFLGLDLFSFTSMALLSYAGFHLLEIVPGQLGLLQEQLNDPGRAGFPSAVVLYLLFVAGAGIGTAAGYLAFGRRRAAGVVSRDPSEPPPEWLWRTGVSFAAFGFALLSIGIYSFGPGAFWNSTYGGTFRFQAELDPRFFVTGMWAVPSAFLVMLAAARTSAQLRFTGLFGISLFLCFNFIGYRGIGYTMLMAAVALTVRRGIVTRKAYIYVTAILLIVLALPLVKTIRLLPTAERLSQGSVAAAFGSLWDGPREVGATFRLLVFSRELVPTRSDYWGGRSYVQAVTHVIPNLDTTWSGTYSDVTKQMRLGEWLTYTMDANTWRSYGGLGSSGIAEPYVNFGAPAVPIHFALLFLMLSWFDWVVRVRLSSAHLAQGALVLMLVCWSARDDTYSVVRGVAWGFFVLWLGKVAFRRRLQGVSCSVVENVPQGFACR
jgi:hypothetical protein